MTADALTITPSKAELTIAYYRKTIIAAAPVVLAGLVVLQDAVQSGHGVDGPTYVLALLALAQAVGTYFPSAATAKLIASGVIAIGSGITACVVGGVSSADILLVLTQLLTWAGAGVVTNGPRPDVALRALNARGEPLPE